MPLVSMRQLLDHAAEYRLRTAGLQRQQPRAGARHHGSGRRDRQPGHHAGLGRRAKVRGRSVSPSPDPGGDRGLSARSGRHAPGPRPVAGGLHERHPVRLLERDDGRLADGGRQVALVLRIQRRDLAQGRRLLARDRRDGRGRARRARLARDHARRQGRRPRRRRHDDARAIADGPRPGGRLRQEDPVRRARDRYRHLARRLQVHAQAHGRHPRHPAHQGNPRTHPEHAPRDARLERACRRSGSRSSASTAAR